MTCRFRRDSCCAEIRWRQRRQQNRGQASGYQGSHIVILGCLQQRYAPRGPSRLHSDFTVNSVNSDFSIARTHRRHSDAKSICEQLTAGTALKVVAQIIRCPDTFLHLLWFIEGFSKTTLDIDWKWLKIVQKMHYRFFRSLLLFKYFPESLKPVRRKLSLKEVLSFTLQAWWHFPQLQWQWLRQRHQSLNMCSSPFIHCLVNLLVLLVFMCFSWLLELSLSRAERQHHHSRTSGLQCWKQNLGCTLRLMGFMGGCLLNVWHILTSLWKSLELPSSKAWQSSFEDCLGLFQTSKVFFFQFFMNYEYHWIPILSMYSVLVVLVWSGSALLQANHGFLLLRSVVALGLVAVCVVLRVPLVPQSVRGRYWCAERQALGGGGDRSLYELY